MDVSLVVFLFIIAVLTLVIIRSVDLGKAIIAIITGNPLPPYFELAPARMPANYEQYLYNTEKFYRSLNRKQQRSYRSRIMKFMKDKQFEGREGIHLTREMVLSIAAAAVKITFGLRDFHFSAFHSVIIYPDEFYSPISKQRLKGEANSKGIIVFSWEDFEYGNSISDDSINLGYHEFAHALFIDHLMYPYEDEFKVHYREWLSYIRANRTIQLIKNRKIFRDYATINEMEFFAVALENFFENPDYFKQELPAIYGLMVKILNQDLSMK